MAIQRGNAASVMGNLDWTQIDQEFTEQQREKLAAEEEVGQQKLWVQLVKRHKFLREVARRITASTQEPLALQYLLQRVAVAVQRGNTASVLGSL